MRCSILVLAALLAISACKSEGDEVPAGPAPTGTPPGQPVPHTSNIVTIRTAVPYGKQVSCADVIDPSLFSKHIGDKIGEVKDRAKSNSESSLSCGLIRAGDPPKTDAQLRRFQREGMKLGVLPGDEYCLVTAYCSLVTDMDAFKKKCEDQGDQSNDAVGQFACVHTTQRGTKDAYTYRTIDPETQCLLEVMGGPSVTDEPLVQNCTRAALEDILPDELKNFH